MLQEDADSFEFTYLQFNCVLNHNRRSLLSRLADAWPFFRSGWNRKLSAEFRRAHNWKVEIREHDCITTREIGIDASGNPIVCAPSGSELGYWTEWHPDWTFYEDSMEATTISEAEFEEDWKKLNP